MIIATKTFIEKELKKVRKTCSLTDVRLAIQRFKKGIRRHGETEFAHFGVKNSKVAKLHVVRRDTGRLVILIMIQQDIIIPLLIRKKSDKTGGENMNVRLMERELRFVIERILFDYKSGHFQMMD